MLALVVLTCLTLITLDSRSGRTGPLGAAGRLAHTIVSPIDRATSAATRPVSDWWSGLIDSGSLKRDNRRLRDQVAALEGKQHKAAAAIAENEKLRLMLSLGFLDTAHAVTARVIDRNPGNFESTITIDRGQEAGIQKDMAVYAFNGVVGHVIDSWHGGAKVRVLTDPESAVAVRTVDDPATGIAQGRSGSRELVVADFGETAKVRKHDEVVTSDISNSVFPPDLPVGVVTSVEKQSAGLGLIVHIDPYIDFDTLEFVDVLRWVPGEGPVLPTTTTTTTTLPSASTTTTLPSASTTTTTGP